jgi:hypothetical protein
VAWFGKLSRLRAVIGLKPQLTSMNFNLETWSSAPEEIAYEK